MCLYTILSRDMDPCTASKDLEDIQRWFWVSNIPIFSPLLDRRAGVLVLRFRQAVSYSRRVVNCKWPQYFWKSAVNYHGSCNGVKISP
ncbi:hypothetical protein BDW69DRAFT_179469 [Aspergillus filifer]